MKDFNRRHLITSGTTALALSTLLASETKGVQANATPFLVRSGEAREGDPLIVQGDKNAFSTKVRGTDGNQRYSVVEVHTPPERGPLLHIHPSQNELIFVLSGSVGVQCGPGRIILNVGDTFMVPTETPHGYVTLGTVESRMLNIFDPPGQMEHFFQELASVLNASGPLDQNKLASVYESHGIRVAGPPLLASSFTASKG